MKKIINRSCKSLLLGLLLFAGTSAFAQTSPGTVNPGSANDPMAVDPGNANDSNGVHSNKTNDPMLVTPGKPNDSLAVKPGKTNDPMAAMTDTGFINKNIIDNQMEIQLAKLGREKGTSAAVKKVAGQMVTDHTAILNDLRRLAAKKGAGSAAGNMDAKPDMPADLSGGDFNAKWASAMLTMHEAKIDELEKFSATTHDEALKAAIGKALPKIRAHRNMLAKLPGAKVTKEPNSVVQ